MDISLFLLWVPAMLALGLVSGFLAGLLGIGGGIVLVPGLFLCLTAFDAPAEHIMHVAVGTSLAIIIPTGLSSVRAHRRRSAVRGDLMRAIGAGIVFGVMAGTLIAGAVSGAWLTIIFAIALAMLSVIMMMEASKMTLGETLPPQPWPALMGSVIGMLSTLMGIGGATISVPYMTAYRVPIHQAIGTAAALGLIISVPAALGFVLIGYNQPDLPPFSLGFINLLAFALIAPASVLTAPFGAHVAHKVAVKPLRRIFAVFILIVAVKMISGVFA